MFVENFILEKENAKLKPESIYSLPRKIKILYYIYVGQKKGIVTPLNPKKHSYNIFILHKLFLQEVSKDFDQPTRISKYWMPTNE